MSENYISTDQFKEISECQKKYTSLMLKQAFGDYKVKNVSADGLTVDENGVVSLNVRTAALEADTAYTAYTNKPILCYANFNNGRLTIGIQERLYDASRDISPTALNLVTEKALAKHLAEPNMALFIDLWNQAVDTHGTYNAETGFFELNGLTDITYEEAKAIYTCCCGKTINAHKETIAGSFAGIKSCNIRTVFPIYFAVGDIKLNMEALFHTNSTIEVVRFVCNAANNLIADMSYTFYSCFNLKHIYGTLYVSRIKNFNTAFSNTYALETVHLHGLSANLEFPESSLLSLESLTYIIANAANTVAITITVHPDVYAKLTDETNTEWHKVLTDAAAKNISFATTE